MRLSWTALCGALKRNRCPPDQVGWRCRAERGTRLAFVELRAEPRL